jgi:membrane protein
MKPARFLRFFHHLTFKTLRKTIVRAFQRRLMGLSAEMAFNALLALFPAILAVFTAVGLFEDTLAAPLQNWANRIRTVAPQEVWILLNDFVNSLQKSKNSGLFSISFIAAIWIASGALSAAMNALDQIHQVPVENRRPIWKAKLVSIILTIGTIMLLLLASFLVFVSDWLINLAVDQTGASILLTFWRLLSWPVALGIISTAFAFVYRFGTSSWDHGRPILPGAILAALSWAGVSALFRMYVSNFGNYNQVYGALGAVIILMLWLYMTALIMLLGDQLNTTVGEAMDPKLRKRRSRLRAIRSRFKKKT